MEEIEFKVAILNGGRDEIMNKNFATTKFLRSQEIEKSLSTCISPDPPKTFKGFLTFYA